jgi:general secretion pathway protein B
MSFILDALRRAEAQRARSAVPGLNAQPLPPLADDADPAARRGPGLWLTLGLGLGLLLPLGAWLMFGRGDEPGAAPGMPVPQAAAPSPPPAQPGIHNIPATATGPSAVAQPAPAVAAVAAAAAPLAGAPVAPAAPPAITPKVYPAPAAAAVPRPQSASPSPRAAEPPATRPAASSAPASASEPRLLTVAELPDDVRRGLPAMAIGGSIYSKDPASRYVIIDGQLLREKDEVAPGVSIEQIRQRSAVLVTRGYRFSIGI